MFANLKPLILMQLKDKIDMSFLKSKKATISKIIFSVLGFAAVTALIYFALYFAAFLKLFSYFATVPVSVIIVVYSVMLALSIISCTMGLTKNLYFAKDNQVLLTLPVGSNTVFFSKIIVFYLYELIKSLYFIVPLFLAYGIFVGMPFLFFLWLPFCVIFISLLPVAVGALLSIPAMYISMFLKNHNILKIATFTAFVAFIVFAVIRVIAAIPSNLDIVRNWQVIFYDMQNFLNNFVDSVPALEALTTMITGGIVGAERVVFTSGTFTTLGALVLSCIALLLLGYFIAKPLFLKMASVPFEYKKTLVKNKKFNKVNKSFASSIVKENKMIFRTPEELYSLLTIFFALPLMIFLLNKIFTAMSTSLQGVNMVVGFNFLIILLVSLASNVKIASAYSREGNAGHLIKTRPNNYSSNLVAKIITTAVAMVISIIISNIVFFSFYQMEAVAAIFFTVSAVLLYLMHLLWSLELDIMNPQTRLYQTSGVQTNNPNENKSSIIALIISFAVTAFAIFIVFTDITTLPVISWLKIALVSAALLLLRCYTFFSRIKHYFKEKQ